MIVLTATFFVAAVLLGTFCIELHEEDPNEPAGTLDEERDERHVQE